jgi:hypothetical protein
MNNEPSPTGSVPVSGMRRVDEICERFEGAWKAGQRPRIEDYIGQGAEGTGPQGMV